MKLSTQPGLDSSTAKTETESAQPAKNGILSDSVLIKRLFAFLFLLLTVLLGSAYLMADTTGLEPMTVTLWIGCCAALGLGCIRLLLDTIEIDITPYQGPLRVVAGIAEWVVEILWLWR